MKDSVSALGAGHAWNCKLFQLKATELYFALDDFSAHVSSFSLPMWFAFVGIIMPENSVKCVQCLTRSIQYFYCKKKYISTFFIRQQMMVVSLPAVSRRWARPAGRVWRLHTDHLRPLLAEGQRRVLARGVSAVRSVPTAAHCHLLLQRHQTLLQERLPAVRQCLLFWSTGRAQVTGGEDAVSGHRLRTSSRRFFG